MVGQDRGILSGVMRADTLNQQPGVSTAMRNRQPWIVFGGGWDGRQRRVTSDAMTDRRHPDGKVAMALEGPDLRSGAYAWIAARQAATMAEPHSLTHDAQTRLHLAPRRRLNACHQYPASAANSARDANSVSAADYDSLVKHYTQASALHSPPRFRPILLDLSCMHSRNQTPLTSSRSPPSKNEPASGGFFHSTGVLLNMDVSFGAWFDVNRIDVLMNSVV
jgi:hypothetical protein